MIVRWGEDEEVLAVYVDPDRRRGEREAAFSELLARYERRVYAVCYRQLGNHADAEDAAQDTFVHLARRAHQFRGDSKLSTFVYRIAVNACRDAQRKQARRPQTPVADVTQAQADAGLTPDTAADEVTGRETALQVQAALDQLDDLSQTLIVLCAIEGYSYPEASEILDLPVGTIKSRVFRARARLAELLAGLDGDTEADVTPLDTPPPLRSVTPPGTPPRGPPIG
jgi:RNA polymerase sigma-70 factor, ECF subfamily